MKKKFTIGGGLFGACFGIGVMAVAHAKAPGRPGTYELLVQVGVVAALVVVGAIQGFVAGWLVSFLGARRKIPNSERSDSP